ncbi:fibroblast growth factor receptor 1 [Sarotherodon galilaeus]
MAGAGLWLGWLPVASCPLGLLPFGRGACLEPPFLLLRQARGYHWDMWFRILTPRPSGGPAAVLGVEGGPGSGSGVGDWRKMFKMKAVCCRD